MPQPPQDSYYSSRPYEYGETQFSQGLNTYHEDSRIGRVERTHTYEYGSAQDPSEPPTVSSLADGLSGLSTQDTLWSTLPRTISLAPAQDTLQRTLDQSK
jgi:hypothetical protein